MKKLFLILALAASMQVAGAQVKTIAAAKSAAESAQKAADDAKKATKFATWLKLGQSMIDAYGAPLGEGWIGASEQELALVMSSKPLSEEQVEIGGQPYIKKVYDTKNYYFNANGQLAIMEVTEPIYEDALDRAVEAYKKAYELDEKASKTKEILSAISTIDQKYNDQAYTAYTMGDLAKASELFEKAAAASVAVPGSQLDTNAVYNTGYTAFMAENYDRAKEFFQKSIDSGYDGENGEAYAKLAAIAEKQGDKEGSKNILETAFTKYPQSQSILIGLINCYLESGSDTDRLFELVNEAKANEPDNPSLYYVEGNIRSQLGQEAEAFAAWDKCAEINPNYAFGYVAKGIYLYNKAVDIQEQANNEMDDAKYMKLVEDFEASLKGCIEPFEKAYETIDEGSKKGVAEYLKNATFRFRTESEEAQARYEKYSTAAAQ